MYMGLKYKVAENKQKKNVFQILQPIPKTRKGKRRNLYMIACGRFKQVYRQLTYLFNPIRTGLFESV